MRFLVTGGCGFVGSAVVRTLVERGERVLNIDRRRRAPAHPALASVQGRDGYARLEADISDRTLMRAIFREFQPDKVIHLAGSQAETGEALFDAEIGGAFSILEAARAHMGRLDPTAREQFRIVHASDVEHDRDTDLETDRESCAARDAVRNAAATLVEGWSRGHDLPLVSCVADQVFGPWQPDNQLLPALVSSLLEGRTFTLTGAGERLRDWLPVRDFADGLILAAGVGAPMGRYEFSVGAERRDIDVAESACALLDQRAPSPDGQSWSSRLAVTGKPALVQPAALDSADAERELGWAPAGFHTGLDRAIAWACNRARAQSPAKAPSSAPTLAAE